MGRFSPDTAKPVRVMTEAERTLVSQRMALAANLHSAKETLRGYIKSVKEQRQRIAGMVTDMAELDRVLKFAGRKRK